MSEPTYSLPVTLLGARSGRGFFADEFSGSIAKAILAMEHGAVTSTDGEGRSMSIWPPNVEPHRETIARLTGSFWPAELADNSPEGRRALIAKLGEILKAERKRGLDRSFAYDLPRHFALHQCWKVEQRLLESTGVAQPQTQ